MSIHTTINILKDRVPSHYQYAISKLKEKLGSTIASDDTPFDIAKIREHIGGFEHDWVKTHPGCHFKGAVPTSTPAPTTDNVTPLPIENQNLAADPATTTVAPTSNRPKVIGGKQVPPTDPNGVSTQSAASDIAFTKTDDGRYTGSVHITLSKMQEVVLSNFADTMPEGSEAREVITQLTKGIINFNLSAGGDTEG